MSDAAEQPEHPEQPVDPPAHAEPKSITPKPFEGRRRGPARFAGVVYQYSDAAKGWTRHILRRYRDGGVYWTRTFYVPVGVPFCMRCLSTGGQIALRHDEASGSAVAWYTCQDAACAISYCLLEEAEEGA